MAEQRSGGDGLLKDSSESESSSASSSSDSSSDELIPIVPEVPRKRVSSKNKLVVPLVFQGARRTSKTILAAAFKKASITIDHLEGIVNKRGAALEGIFDPTRMSARGVPARPNRESNDSKEVSVTSAGSTSSTDTLRAGKLRHELPRTSRISDPVRCGFLEKFSDSTGGRNSFRIFKKRYFILKNDLLFYLQSGKDKKPLGVIELSGDGVHIESSSEKESKNVQIRIVTPKKVYLLRAETPQECQEWLRALRLAKATKGFLSSTKNFVVELKAKTSDDSRSVPAVTIAAPSASTTVSTHDSSSKEREERSLPTPPEPAAQVHTLDPSPTPAEAENHEEEPVTKENYKARLIKGAIFIKHRSKLSQAKIRRVWTSDDLKFLHWGSPKHLEAKPKGSVPADTLREIRDGTCDKVTEKKDRERRELCSLSLVFKSRTLVLEAPTEWSKLVWSQAFSYLLHDACSSSSSQPSLPQQSPSTGCESAAAVGVAPQTPAASASSGAIQPQTSLSVDAVIDTQGTADVTPSKRTIKNFLDTVEAST
eukprot:GILJ01004293.1.p1 GENE.GILJ01004293.1~~GILJ01004293.1.p1  ORF type:complete len:539 (-),score=77.25 GILJ01004293.1:103-1719(-)